MIPNQSLFNVLALVSAVVSLFAVLISDGPAAYPWRRRAERRGTVGRLGAGGLGRRDDCRLPVLCAAIRATPGEGG